MAKFDTTGLVKAGKRRAKPAGESIHYVRLHEADGSWGKAVDQFGTSAPTEIEGMFKVILNFAAKELETAIRAGLKRMRESNGKAPGKAPGKARKDAAPAPEEAPAPDPAPEETPAAAE